MHIRKVFYNLPTMALQPQAGDKNTLSTGVVYIRLMMGSRCIRSHPDSFTIKAEILTDFPLKSLRLVYNRFTSLVKIDIRFL